MRYIIFIFIFSFIAMGGWLFLKNNYQQAYDAPQSTLIETSSSTPIKASPTIPIKTSPTWLEKTTKLILAKAPNINPIALKISLTAYENAKKEGLYDKEILTIIDYSKPSSQRRLWVINLKTGTVLFNTWVAHGKNSGLVSSTSFSNSPRSLKSSIGVYMTDEIYNGHNGYSLRVQGLEPGFNNNALKRNIVFHGAAYVGEDIAKDRGMLGHSWGCMAVALNIIKPLVQVIKNQTLVIAYYPDKNWLRHSSFLS